MQASPRLRFNKEGSLLAVTTTDSGIKILANNDGLRLIRMLEGRAMEKNRGTSEPINNKVVFAMWSLGSISKNVYWPYSLLFVNRYQYDALPFIFYTGIIP